MKFDMNGILDELLPHISHVLVSPDAIAVIRNLNERLPAGLSTSGVIECYMGINDARADWQLCVNGLNWGRDVIAGKISVTGWDNSLFDDHRWRHIRSFSKNWAAPSTQLHNKIRQLWLAFDQDDMKKKEPVPGVYFNVRQVSGNSEDKMKESNGAEYKLVIGVLEQLRGRPLRNEVSSRLRKCFEALPKASTVDHAGIMLSRNQNVARMVLTIDKETLQDYLVEIEYPGSIQEVLELTAEFGQFANIRYIIDVSDTVLPKIGMECLVLNDNGDNKSVWERLLGYLVARSLCIPQKMDALLSWPGHASALLASDLWPSYIIRRISHIKIVCQNKGPLEAKGYLQFHRKFTIELINALESAENGR